MPAVSKVNSPFLQLNMTLFSKSFIDLKANVIFPRLWGCRDEMLEYPLVGRVRTREA